MRKNSKFPQISNKMQCAEQLISYETRLGKLQNQEFGKSQRELHSANGAGQASIPQFC